MGHVNFLRVMGMRLNALRLLRPVPAARLALPRARFLCSGGKSNALATGQLTNERGEVSGFTCTYAAAGLGGFSPRLLASPKMIDAIISLRRPG